MKVTRRALFALACSSCASKPRSPATLRGSLERGIEWLWRAQSRDGGWHSATYGLLESGQSLTPFVLGALLDGSPKRTSGVSTALDFIRRHTAANGALGLSDPLLSDYPCYSTALTAVALKRAGADPARMIAWLRTQQFGDENGWRRDDAPYGAWGMGGEPRTPPNPGHVDLSMTRHVLQALTAAGVAPSDPAMTRARVFLGRCQNADGGFCFSTVVLDANKAGSDGGRFRSYGTATADGILALLATGAANHDPRVQSAQRWLLAHHLPDRAPGFIGDAYRRWPAGLRYYYASASSAALRRLSLAQNDAQADDMVRTQRPDGSWRNSESLVKEDDPLIATVFAVQALAAGGGSS
ncbi:MAG: hypothetical protein ACRD8O_08305 [Bryobacteraceae bacterium]